MKDKSAFLPVIHRIIPRLLKRAKDRLTDRLLQRFDARVHKLNKGCKKAGKQAIYFIPVIPVTNLQLLLRIFI